MMSCMTTIMMIYVTMMFPFYMLAFSDISLVYDMFFDMMITFNGFLFEYSTIL